MIKAKPIIAVGGEHYALAKLARRLRWLKPGREADQREIHRLARTALAPLGYEPSARDNCSYAQQILINAARQVVIKLPYVYGAAPARAVPTVELPAGFVRQPLVDTSCDAVRRATQAVADTTPWTRRVEQWGHDAHAGNIGMLNGEPVVFDW